MPNAKNETFDAQRVPAVVRDQQAEALETETEASRCNVTVRDRGGSRYRSFTAVSELRPSDSVWLGLGDRCLFLSRRSEPGRPEGARLMAVLRKQSCTDSRSRAAALTSHFPAVVVPVLFKVKGNVSAGKKVRKVRGKVIRLVSKKKWCTDGPRRAT
ncbi:hypothetical protein EYF80_038352 [Liparis tanakae]|uniref:Uncharacterized protein n=1 Tax=Liparis tanakae TaxID=230148 RepID=A0A4Z2GDU4_9TELE|nr:hypothetical protein EYF80_038352 [Liparis tanakae]